MTRMSEARIARQALDEHIGLAGGIVDNLQTPKAGWVRAIRDALGMSAAEVAERLGVTQPAVFELEGNERRGTARLDTLRRAADAMDCDLVYAFVPRRGLEETVRARAELLADQQLATVRHSMALEDQSVPVSSEQRAALVEQLMTTRGLWARR